jgi:hypothetical protein
VQKKIFKDWRQLTELGYFKRLDDGRLELTVDGLNGLIDCHTHLAWTTLVAPPVDLTRQRLCALHYFPQELCVDLDLYSGQARRDGGKPLWGWRDLAPQTFCPIRLGKHLTHTIPNLLREMDALKIAKSVCLSVDIFGSKNTLRHGKALQNEPRLVFYCMVHPKDKKREKHIDEYLALGARGMKVHPEMQLTRVDAEPMLELLALWKKRSNGLPVLFHSGFNGYEPRIARENAEIFPRLSGNRRPSAGQRSRNDCRTRTRPPALRL